MSKKSLRLAGTIRVNQIRAEKIKKSISLEFISQLQNQSDFDMSILTPN